MHWPAVEYERHGVGYLVGYMPRDLANDQSAQDALLSTLQTMRQDAVAVFPGPKQEGQAGNQSYLVEILTPPGGIPDFEPMLGYYRGEIAGDRADPLAVRAAGLGGVEQRRPLVGPLRVDVGLGSRAGGAHEREYCFSAPARGRVHERRLAQRVTRVVAFGGVKHQAHVRPGCGAQGLGILRL
jgi:hypothetical protein